MAILSPMEKDTLTTAEAAARLGVTATRVRAMIASGRLPAQRFGPVYVIRMSDLKLVQHRKPGRPAQKTVKKSGAKKVVKK